RAHDAGVPCWSGYCRQILVYSLRVPHFSALNDRLETAKDHALAVKWHGVPLGLHAGIGHHLVPSRLRASFDGQTIHENTTVSSSLRWTAIGNDVILPSGTSSPQHSTTLSAPYSLKMAAASSACFLNFSRLAVGTAATNPSM